MQGRWTLRRGAGATFIALVPTCALACSLLVSLDGLTTARTDASQQDSANDASIGETSVESGSGQRVDSYTIVNTDTNADEGPLTDGASLSRAALPANFSVRANTTPDVVGSVDFYVDGSEFNLEGHAPYFVAADDLEDVDIIHPWVVTDGKHTLLAIPYTLASAGGIAGQPLQVTFTIGP